MNQYLENMQTEAHIKVVVKDFEEQKLDYEEKLRDIDYSPEHKDYERLMGKYGDLKCAIGWLTWVLKS